MRRLLSAAGSRLSGCGVPARWGVVAVVLVCAMVAAYLCASSWLLWTLTALAAMCAGWASWTSPVAKRQHNRVGVDR